ncbi:uncharacterized protein [Cicer arietinum]|uniref:Probable serine/threonine-protein kinase kinX isoform X2 n=1 Tax=Cicer arietinum TaxID=3827 RepID=A0A1S2Y303_CICAR|nr:probable serine/threonine-protein kinase kinX isoform X2 [Cicer arietinum]
MDVMLGPAFSIDVPSSPPYAGNVFFDGDSSGSSSSIGTPDDSDIENDNVSPKRNREEDDEDEVQSKFKGLNSLDSLEDSLPIKKGLSNHFIGKSKSFSDLSQVTNVKELKKQENPFNKRRRVLIASKLSRKSSFYSCFNPKSMPLLPVDEHDDDDDEEDYENEGEYNKEDTTKGSPSSSSSSIEEKKNPQEVMMRQFNNNRMPHSYANHMRLRLGSFKSRSFSLADLQEHDEVEEEEVIDHDEDNDEQHLD